MKHIALARLPFLILCTALFLSGCSPAEEAGSAAGTWQPSPPLVGTFSVQAAQGNAVVQLDVPQTAQGIVGVQALSEKRLKFQILSGETTYNHDITGGVPSVFPLVCGSGRYTFRVMENTTENKYIALYEATYDVALADEFAPFLRSSAYVNYTESSACVQLAQQMAQEVTTDADFVAEVYDYLKENIAYDYALAESDPLFYYPQPDVTLSSGKGICFDYAALAAAMLRSQGIPAKVLTGYVSPDNLYHAWNMIYLQGKGWITVGLQASPHKWQRIDITFAATGADGFSGNGTQYTDRYTY